MKIACPGCHATYSIEDSRIPAGGINMKCPKCSAVFAVRREAVAGAVPLPGGTPGPAGGFVSPGPAGAVPLPGLGHLQPHADDGAVQLPGLGHVQQHADAGAVPLPGPGHVDAVPLPGQAAGLEFDLFGPPEADAVPLPGLGSTAPMARPPAAPPPGPPPGALAPPPGPPPGARGAQSRTVQLPGADVPEVPLPDDFAPERSVSFGELPEFTDEFDPVGSFDAGKLPPADAFPPQTTPVLPNRPPAPLPDFDPPPPDLGADFGAFDLGAPPPPPQQTQTIDPFEFGEVDFDPPPPPPEFGGLEFDPTGTMPGGPPPPPRAMAPGLSQKEETDLALLDFIDGPTPGPAKGETPSGRFHVRRKTGKTFGPFAPAAVVKMLEEGQLLGNEDVSTDGEAWAPIESVPEFAAAIPESSLTAAPAGNGPRIPVPVLGAPAEAAPAFPGKIKPPSAVERARAWMASRPPLTGKQIGISIAVAVLGIGAIQEVATPYGFLFRKPLFGYSGPEAGSPLARLLDQAGKEIARDNHASYGRALAAAESALQMEPEDVHAKALFAQAVFALERDFGGQSTNLGRAQAYVDALAATVNDDHEVRKARAAAAIHAKKYGEVAGLLAPLGKDPEALFLRAAADVRAKAPEAKASVDALVAAAPGSAKALHLAGLVATDAAAAKSLFEKALAADAQHAASAIELAALALETDAVTAQKHLDAALGSEAVAGLGGRVLARAHALQGTTHWRLRKATEADASFQKALAADGTVVEARVRYNDFLIDRHRYDEAAKVMEKAWSHADGDLAVAEQLVRAYIVAGKMLQADKLVQGLESQRPDDPRLSFLAGKILASNKEKLAEAEAAFREALTKDPAYTKARVALIRALIAAGKLPAAKTEAQEAVKNAASSAAVHVALGEVLAASGDTDGAIASFDQAIALRPENDQAYVGKARALESRQDWAAARSTYETLLQINDAVADYHLAYGTALWKLQQHEPAVAALKLALAIDEKSARAHSRLGAVLFDAGRIDEAIASIESALALDNTNPETYLYLARLQAAKGDNSAAVHAVNRAIALDAANATYPFERGRIYAAAGSPVEALESFKKALALDPSRADVWEEQGRTLVTLNALSQAVKSFESALAKDPSRTQLLVTIGDCYLRSNQWDRAIAALTKASQSNPPLKGAAFKLGLAYQEKGRSAQAIPFLQRAAREDPSDASPYRQLGYAYKERNQIGNAVQAFKTYLARKPEADDRAEIEDEIATLRF